MKSISLVVLPLLWACGSAPVESPGAPAETARLRRQYVIAEGGARQLLHLVDTRTGEPCDFRASSDVGAPGTCVPTRWGSPVYLDESCAQPAVQSYAAVDGWVAVARPGNMPADRLEKLVRLGERVRADAALWWLSPQGCVSTVPTGAPVYTIAEELSRDAMAAGLLEPHDLGGGLRATVFDGDDGSQLVTALADGTSGASCRPGTSGAGARCVPEQGTLTHDGLYDERCERIGYGNFVGTPVAAVTDLGGATYRFGERIFDTTVTVGRRGPGGACVTEQRAVPRTGALYFGVPYPSSEWPALELAREGDGRITASVATLPEGTRYFEAPARFEDRGAACAPIWVDRVLRCLPLPIYPNYGAYADPACTAPIVVLRDEEGVPPAGVTVVDATGDAAQGNLPIGRVRQIGREVAEVYTVTRSREGCSRWAGEGRRFFEFGEDASPAPFAELTLVTE